MDGRQKRRCPVTWRAYLLPLGLTGLGLLMAATGCGRQSGQGRLPVFGKVRGPGDERVNGAISFLPAPGRSGPAAVGSIVNGEYRFDETTGPMAGACQVTIRRTPVKTLSPAEAKPPRRDQRGGPGNAPKTEWTFQADVPAAGPYGFDYNLD